MSDTETTPRASTTRKSRSIAGTLKHAEKVAAKAEEQLALAKAKAAGIVAQVKVEADAILRAAAPATPATPVKLETLSAQDFLQLKVRTGALAAALGISTQRLGQLIDDGTLEKSGHGLIGLDQIKPYCKRLSEAAAGRRSADGLVDPVAAKAKLTELQCEMLQLQIDQRKGELLEISAIQQQVGMAVSAVRQSFLSLPSRFRNSFPGADAAVTTWIEREILDLLDQLSSSANAAVEDAQESARRGDDDEAAGE